MAIEFVAILLLMLFTILVPITGWVYFWMEDLFKSRLHAWLAATLLLEGAWSVIYFSVKLAGE